MAGNRNGQWSTSRVAFAMVAGWALLGTLCGSVMAQTTFDPLRPHPYSFTKVLDDKPTGGEPPTAERLNAPPSPGRDLGSNMQGGFTDEERPIHPLRSEEACDSCAGCGSCDACCPARATWLQNSSLFLLFDSFQNQLEPQPFITHANFGTRIGGYTAIPLWDAMGISLEGGASAGWYDYRGTVLARPTARFQNFWTAAFSQRLLCDEVAWGFAHDWLYDNYLPDPVHLGQWRTKIAWQANPCNQFGIWASVADRGDNARDVFLQQARFRPFSQGNLYWQHEWHSAITTTLSIGKAGPPGDWVFGSSANVPLSQYMALYANGNYILPGREPFGPGTGEVWNFTLGLQFYPGSAMRPNTLSHRPLFNLVDNSTMAIRRF